MNYAHSRRYLRVSSLCSPKCRPTIISVDDKSNPITKTSLPLFVCSRDESELRVRDLVSVERRRLDRPVRGRASGNPCRHPEKLGRVPPRRRPRASTRTSAFGPLGPSTRGSGSASARKRQQRLNGPCRPRNGDTPKEYWKCTFHRVVPGGPAETAGAARRSPPDAWPPSAVPTRRWGCAVTARTIRSAARRSSFARWFRSSTSRAQPASCSSNSSVMGRPLGAPSFRIVGPGRNKRPGRHPSCGPRLRDGSSGTQPRSAREGSRRGDGADRFNSRTTRGDRTRPDRGGQPHRPFR